MTKLSLLCVTAVAAYATLAVPASAQRKIAAPSIVNAYTEGDWCANREPGNPYNKTDDYIGWSSWRVRGGWDDHNDFNCAPYRPARPASDQEKDAYGFLVAHPRRVLASCLISPTASARLHPAKRRHRHRRRAGLPRASPIYRCGRAGVAAPSSEPRHRPVSARSAAQRRKAESHAWDRRGQRDHILRSTRCWWPRQ